MQMAAWRETGALIGICLAAIAPGAIAVWFAKPMIGFVIGFAGIGLLATWAMRKQWSAFAQRQPSNFSVIWQDRNARRLLVLAFVNALPVAVSSSLFLFFVAHKLEASSWAGPLLVLFFLSAALSAPFWAGAARRFGTRRVLLIAMINAVMIFGFCSFLGAGDVMFFAAVCIFSGASIGADLTLMPAAFAERLAFIAPNGGQGFGLWSLMNKMTLALAAIVLFPILELAGFDATVSEQTTEALDTLMILYAVCPLILKLVSIVLLIKTPLQDDQI